MSTKGVRTAMPAIDHQRFYSTRASQLTGTGRPGAGAPAGPDIISLAGGRPDPGSFPVVDLTEMAQVVLSTQGATALTYGETRGHLPLRQAVADHWRWREGTELDSDLVLITNGSSDALRLVAELLCDPGDVVLMEAPTFMGAITTFRLCQAQIEGIPMDDQGILVDVVRERIHALRREGKRVKLIYTLPNFQNPSGVTQPVERRRALVDLAAEEGVLVLEDDAYADIRFEIPWLPALYGMDQAGAVMRCSTFSKSMGAGLRLGWLITPNLGMMERLLRIKRDGGTSPFTSHIVAEYCHAGLLRSHVTMLCDIYRERRDAMLAALERYCPRCTWSHPAGGFFIWVRFPDGVDARRLEAQAHAEGVAYVPGRDCMPDGQGDQYARLAYSGLPPAELAEGIRRLGVALARVMGDG